MITGSDGLGTPPGDVPAAIRALAARCAEAHPAVAASTLLEQAELEEELEQEPEAESETVPEHPEPRRELEPGWTLVDEPEQGAERE